MSVTMDDVVVATSLSPRQMARQAAAMSSWRDAGFTVVSLNVGAEAEALRREPARPDLPIVTIDVDGFYGKPLPRVDDFIRYFRSLDRPYRYFGIINSDIALAEGESLREALRRETAALVFGRRTDVADFADAGGSPFENGYDYFFMSPEAVATLPESRFRIGAPWWDYWVPVVQLTAGRRAVQLPPSVVRHVRHGIAWNEAMLNEMGAHFVERLLAMPHSELLNAATAELLYKRTIRHLSDRINNLGKIEAEWKKVSIQGKVHAAVVGLRRAFSRGLDQPDTYLLNIAFDELCIATRDFIDRTSQGSMTRRDVA